jgi:hypothetical protein
VCLTSSGGWSAPAKGLDWGGGRGERGRAPPLHKA